MTGNQHRANAEVTDIEILRKHGFEVRGVYNLPERDRLNIVNNAFDKSRIHIKPTLKFITRDLEQVTTNDYGQIIKKPGDPLTHISDALGYLCVQQFKPPRQVYIR